MSYKNIFRATLVALSAAGLLTVGAPAAQAQTKDKLPLTILGQPSVNNDSLWMTFDKGYFEEEGLNPTYRLFPSGLTALQAFQIGQGDIVLAGDLPAIQYFFNTKGNFRVIAAMERDTKGYVIAARKEIQKPEDLIGKTIATRVGSSGSWFISEYLKKHNIDPSKVTVKNLDTQLLPTALCQGDIAAFFIWQPFGSRALEICPEKSHILSDATGYIRGYLIAGARADWLATPEGKEKAERFLRAARKGKAIADADFPAVAKYAKTKFDLSENATKAQWETLERPLNIDETFYEDFCSLNKWALETGVSKEPVNFKEFTDVSILQSIDKNLGMDAPDC